MSLYIVTHNIQRRRLIAISTRRRSYLGTSPNVVHINVHWCPNCWTLLLTVSRYTMHSFRPIIYLLSIIHHWVVLSHGRLLRSLWPTTSFHLSCSGWGRHNHDLLFRSAVRGEYHRTQHCTPAHLASANMQAVFDYAVQYSEKGYQGLLLLFLKAPTSHKVFSQFENLLRHYN